jgi:3-oxoacyl-[acyl-carrier protein] reductase
LPESGNKGQSATTVLGHSPPWKSAINPGMVETEGVRAAGLSDSDFRRQVEAQTPLGRIGQPGDIAPAVVFLASDESAWIPGETLHIAGGHR